ncbi:hypothetical protein D925_01970 [Enterococcus faecalis B83616-1]|nr:hypothetical protein D925_01970 [Enterococcus faecalis B83616-1]
MGEIPEKSNGPKKAIMYVTKINKLDFLKGMVNPFYNYFLRLLRYPNKRKTNKKKKRDSQSVETIPSVTLKTRFPKFAITK